MKSLTAGNLTLVLDDKKGVIADLICCGVSILGEASDLFELRLRDRLCRRTVLKPGNFGSVVCKETNGGFVFVFLKPDDRDRALSVELTLGSAGGSVEVRSRITGVAGDELIEWFRPLPLKLVPLEGEGGALGSRLLFPYNEGVIVRSALMREKYSISYKDPDYPSNGYYCVFPNMVFSQMIAYTFNAGDGEGGLYIGLHDPARGPKEINYHAPDPDRYVEIITKDFCGLDFGKDREDIYSVVLKAYRGSWETAAGIYRDWLEGSLPEGFKKISQRDDVPEWYKDSPLILIYPVRGVHDKDVMDPNAFYPYTAALNTVDEISRFTGARIMALLMHWEGTAPWAPPYVWPPYGDQEDFFRYRDELHRRGDLLGVYCSGFGYSVHSNLVDYDKRDEFESRGLEGAVCAAPDGSVVKSPICTGQRDGYDMCPTSDKAKAVLDEAYRPLFGKGIDYVQILDQNHGGGQYFCYSADHGHPPAPGPWMTENMRSLLSGWQKSAPGMLFGCESAASEPFMQYLNFSDNRFELNYKLGRPVPLYAYIYHEYVRNFMGNQCGCPLPDETDPLLYRIAYSFTAGDSLSLTLHPGGNILSRWSIKNFDSFPDKQKALDLIKKLTDLYKNGAGKYLYDGRMIPAPDIVCEDAPFGDRLPSLLWSAWEKDGDKALILVNPFDKQIAYTVDGKKFTAGPYSAELKYL